jgi:hypothetical protein
MGAAPSRGRPLTVPPRPGATGDAPRARTSTPPPIPGAAPPGPPASDPAAGWLSALAASTPPTPTPEGTAPALSALAAAAAGPANGATTAGGSQPPPASGDSTKSAALFGERALDAAAPPEVVPLVPVRKPRLLWIGGGAGALLVLILGIALALHRSGPPAAPALEVAAPPPAEKAAPAPVIAAPAAPPAAARTPPPRPAPPPKAAEVVARPAPEDPGDDNQPLVDGAQAGAHHHHHHSSKVVLDYDAASGPKPASQNPLPDGADDAVAKARSLYRRGTEKLFAGDNSGAVRDYQAALAAYPDYIGGYRGLGVGWERLGNAPRAIAAFNIYLRTVPGARDAPQIRQRIERLEKKR